MASNDYHFITHWRVPGTIEEVATILGDALDLPRWWPSVYLEVRELTPGDDSGLGRTIDLYTKGFLPYTLRWQFRVTQVDFPRGFTLEAEGDFSGRGIWTLEQDEAEVDVVYDWRISANKPLLKRLSFLLKPIFRANHRWAMAKGLQSLRLELQRRHAATPAEREAVPAPPGPTRTRPFLLGGAAASVAALGLLISRRRKGRA